MLVPFSEHWQQTAQERRSKKMTDVVAPALQKFQDIQNWPRSGEPLPDDLHQAVQRKHFSWTGQTLPIAVFLLGLAFTVAAFTLSYKFRREVSMFVIALCWIAGPVLMFVMSPRLSHRMGYLWQHVSALHLCYVDSLVPLSESRQAAYSTLVGWLACTVYLNGDKDIIDLRVCFLLRPLRHASSNIRLISTTCGAPLLTASLLVTFYMPRLQSC